MAQWKWSVSGSTWADATAQTVRTGACRLHSITVVTQPDQGVGYVQGWDSITAIAGTTAPDIAFMLPVYTTQTKRRHKVIFANGGIVCATGVQLFVSTAAGGATAVATTAIPDDVIVDYTPLA